MQNAILSTLMAKGKRSITTRMSWAEFINGTSTKPVTGIDTSAYSVSSPLPDIYVLPKCANQNDLHHIKNQYCIKFDEICFKRFYTTKSSIQFSDKFMAAISSANHGNLHGIGNYSSAEDFFAALVEWTARAYYFDNSNHTFRYFLSELEHHISIGDSHNGILEFHYHGKGIRGFINLISILFTINRRDAIATAGNILGLDFLKAFQMSSDTYSCQHQENNPGEDWIPVRMPCAGNSNQYFTLMDRIDIKGHSGQIIGALLHYKYGEEDFCIAATVGNSQLCIAKYKPTAFFMNQHQMDANPDAIILLFQDARTAIAVQRKLDEIPSDTTKEFVVTAHLGNELNILPWNYLTRHKLIFIPAPSKQSIASGKEYAKYARSVCVKNFNVVSQLFLHTRPNNADWRSQEVTDAEEMRLLQETIVVPDCENMLLQLRKTIANALDENGYAAWGQNLGIFKKPAIIIQDKSTAEVISLPKPHESLMPKTAVNIADVTFSHTIRPGIYVLIGGRKGAGKTHLMLSICRNLLCQTNGWPFFKFDGTFTENICLVDGETSLDAYNENLEQHDLKVYEGKRLFSLSVFASELPEFCQTFSLRNQQFREGLTDYLLKYHCRVLILDSLLLLTGHDPNSCVKEVLDFIKQLQRIGVCVVLTNHNFQKDKVKHSEEESGDKTSKMRGNENYFNEARVAINIVDRDEILAKDSFPEAARKYATKKGLTLGIQYLHHKTAPILDGSTFFFHLPLGGRDWKFLGATGIDEIPEAWGMPECKEYDDVPTITKMAELPQAIPETAEQPQSIADSNVSQAELENKLSALHPQARSVYEAIQKNGGSATRSEIEKSCTLPKDAALDRINELIRLGLLNKDGTGRGAYYRLAKVKD